MIRIILFQVLLTLSSIIFAQDCPDESTGTFELTTQAEVDQFIIDYPNCTILERQLRIQQGVSTVITDLSPLNNLKSVRGLSIRTNGDPVIEGLVNLTEIDGLLQIFQTELTNLDFLENVTLINGSVRIDQNPLLEDISGLINIEPDSIYTITLRNSPLLSVCHYSFVCEMLSRPPPPIGNHRVQFNAPGCEDIDAILAQCDNPIVPPEDPIDPIDPNLCPLTSRPGMQIDKVDDDLYNVMYLYGNERMKIKNINYSTLMELIYHHKVEKDLLFDFTTFRLSILCTMAERIIDGHRFEYSLPNILPPFADENLTMEEIEMFKDFVLTMGENESLKI